MKNIWRLFTSDLKRLHSNIVSIIAVIGLVVLPSIFSWYNMIACWDVFGNTGNLTVAVANSDEGYSSDLVVVKVNLGNQVVSALRENDQLNWVFTDEEDAIDGARSGRYYAAVVIPPSFSRDMMSFYIDDAEHASIIYYSNEKKNAVAPKVTDQGADQISHQINLAFTETLSEVALSVSSALFSYADEADASGALGNLSSHLSRVGVQMGESSSVLELYADILGSTRSLVEDAGNLVSRARESSKEVSATIRETRSAASTISDALDEATAALSSAVVDSSQSYDALPHTIESAFESVDTLSADSATQLRNQASSINVITTDLRTIKTHIEKIKELFGDSQGTIATVISRLDTAISLQDQLRDSLTAAASDIETGNSDVQADRKAAIALANETKESFEDARIDFDESLAPLLEELGGHAEYASSSLARVGDQLDSGVDKIVGSSNSVSEKLANAQDKILSAADDLKRTGDAIANLGAQITQAIAEGDIETLRTIVNADPETFAQAISAPIQLDRQAVFPVENFGSAMSPLYTTLALWIGALLIMITLKLNASERTIEELDNPTPSQLFLGRFGTIGAISFMQSTTVALGNLLFLGVQAVHPLHYMLCFWVAGLVFAFIIYTLVFLFANFGKALSVILLIVQVSGGGGSFPMKLLPSFFQNLGPYLPITHAVNAMRAAMFGIYNNDFWIELGTLALFTVPFIVLGILLHAPLSVIVPRFVERVERSKLM